MTLPAVAVMVVAPVVSDTQKFTSALAKPQKAKTNIKLNNFFILCLLKKNSNQLQQILTKHFFKQTFYRHAEQQVALSQPFRLYNRQISGINTIDIVGG
jgi:hypothetical protein